jgi:hypothetical protein
LNEPVLYNINADKFDIAWAFWKRASDVFVVDDNIAHDRAPDKLGVNVGLAKTRSNSNPYFVMAGGNQFGRVFVLLGIRRIRGEPSIDILGVVSIKLALDNDLWGSIYSHEDTDEKWFITKLKELKEPGTHLFQIKGHVRSEHVGIATVPESITGATIIPPIVQNIFLR